MNTYELTLPSVVQFCGNQFLQQPGVIPTLPLSPHVQALEQFVEGLKSTSFHSILDLGCGAGVLGLSLWHEGCELVMTDCDPRAVALAQQNSQLLNRPAKILCGSWFEPVEGQYDLIIANPPHGLSSDWELFPWSHDLIPRQSVDGGEDGLDAVREILKQAAPYVAGILCIVCTSDQMQRVSTIAVERGYKVKHTQSYMDSSMITLGIS